MTPDERSLEAELQQLRAVALDESFLSRLDAVAAGTSLELTAQEIRFEESLRRLPAASLGADFMAELEKIVSVAPFAPHPKIVPFPAAVAPPAHRQRPIWGAAAAVALIGAVTALLMPSAKPPASPPRQIAAARPTPPTTATGNFIPASFNRDLSEVHDEGVIWKANNQPHSVVRVVYKDQVKFKDANGRTVQVDQPRVEYLLVPAKTD